MRRSALIVFFGILIGAYGCERAARERVPAAEMSWSATVAADFIGTHPDPDVIHWKGQANHFSWQAGYMMFAMEKMWRATGDERYFNYIRRYVDQQVDGDGNIPDFVPDALDNFLPGYAILFMYEQTGLEKYRIAATRVREGFDRYPRNADGSFWHGAWAPNQLWIDGVFMGQMFLARYAVTIGDSEYAFGEVVRQLTLALGHCGKSNGLWLHGWDESRTAAWADRETGLAPEVWSEGLGWIAVLLADVFDYLPAGHPDREQLLDALFALCEGLKQVQDPDTGMWYQVVDRPGQPDNWNETSGTGMFLYLIRKSMERGYIDRREFEPVVRRAYEGIVRKARLNDAGSIDIVECSSIGIMPDYETYVSQPKETNTFAGISSFILGTAAMEHMFPDAPSRATKRDGSPYVPPGNGLRQHPFMYIGEWDVRNPGEQSMFLVRDGRVVWTYSVPLRTESGGIQEFDDVTVLSNGNIVYANMSGAGIITPDKEVIWEFICADGEETHSCQPIGDGKVLLALNAPSPKVLVIDTVADRVVREIDIPTTTANPHSQFRHVRITGSNTIMVPLLGENRVVEYTMDGEEIWSVDAPTPWSAIRLHNGNTLISGDIAGYTREVNSDGDIVWELTQDDVPFRLFHTQAANRLANGNTVISNWCAGRPNMPAWPHTVQVFEVTPEKRVVWALSSWGNPDLGPNTYIQLLDEPGNPDTGELQR